MEVVVQGKKAASMKTLHKIHGLKVNDSRYRSKLKQRIQKEFGDQLFLFLSSKHNLPEVIVSSDYFTADSVHHSCSESLKNVASVTKRYS